MSPLLLSTIIFALLVVAAVGFFGAIGGHYRAVDDRLSEMNLKMKIAYGTLNTRELEQEGVARALFKWALERVPPPKLDTPEGKKMSRLLIQAGYLSSRAPRRLQLIRIGSAVGGSILGLTIS